MITKDQRKTIFGTIKQIVSRVMLVVGALIVAIFVLIVVVYISEMKPEVKKDEAAGCMIIGKSIDGTKSGDVVRKIYECSNGFIIIK